MTKRTVYQSTDPEIVAMLLRNEKARQKWGRAVRAVAKEAFGKKAKGGFYQYGGDTWASFVPSGELPEGWRYDRKTGGWVPDRRTAEGKAWQKRIEEVRRLPAPEKPPGQASSFADFDNGSMYFRVPNFCVFNDVAYCVWGGEPKEDQIDAALWQRMRLSEFIAVCEDQDIEVSL